MISPVMEVLLLQTPTEKLPQEEPPKSELTEDHELQSSSDPDTLLLILPMISEFPQRAEEPKHDRNSEPTEDPSSTTTESDSKNLSSEESSEDEEIIKESAEKEAVANSILPSSVLDKASTIAQHFTNGIKRGSQAQEDGHSLSCTSPRLPSRTSSSLNLGAESVNQPLQLSSVTSDTAEIFDVTNLSLLSPQGDSLFDGDQSIQHRRDSILSKQDQLLISKIKSYYENAESQNATFSLQRRESLTYIPAGLVRSSVSRFNSNPKDQAFQTNSSIPTSSFNLESDLTLSTDAQDPMVSNNFFESLKSDQRSTNTEYLGEMYRSRSQGLKENPSEAEEFRPSSEMIKVWRTMEQEITRSQRQEKRQEQHQEAPNNSKVNVNLSGMTLAQNKHSDQESGGPSTILRVSRSPLPLWHKVPGMSHTGSPKDSLKMFREEAIILRAPAPVTQLKVNAKGERPGEYEVDKTKTKVLHLARQYSQRIKSTKPVVQQRSQGVLISKKSLPCVQEEKESVGRCIL